MLPTTIPDTNSVTKDSQTVEMGGVYTGDETELARMGYRQELKFVQFNFTFSSFEAYNTRSARRDLTLMQVRCSDDDDACAVFEGARPTELWCLVFHHQYSHWYPTHVSLRFGEHSLER